MCGLEVPDLIQQVWAEFPNGEVEAYAVATDDEAEGIADYIEDTGLRSLVLLDTGPGFGADCQRGISLIIA